MADQNQMYVAAIGIISVTALELMALYKGLDGAYLAAVVGGVCTIVGLCFGVKLTQTKEQASV